MPILPSGNKRGKKYNGVEPPRNEMITSLVYEWSDMLSRIHMHKRSHGKIVLFIVLCGRQA
jgi:hypothetical protein